MKKNINEQTTTSIDLRDAKDTYECPFVVGGTLVSTTGYPNGAIEKRATTASKATPANFEIGDVLYIKSDYTYDVARDNKIINTKLKWACSISAKQEKVIDDFVRNNPEYQKENPGDEKVGEGKGFTKMDISEIPNLKNTNLFSNDFRKYNLYKRTGISGKSQDYVSQFETMLKEAGYTFDKPLARQEYLSKTKRKITDIIGSIYSDEFGTVPWVYMSDEEYKRLKGLTKSDCRNSIRNLYKAFKDPGRSTMELPVRIRLKNEVWFCSNKNYASGILGLGNEIKDILSVSSSYNNGYGMKNYNPTSPMYESVKKDNLNKLLRENLIEIKKQKIKESKIVKNRFKFISENVSLKTKKQKDKFCGDLLNEMIYLNSQGYDKQVIKEQFFDILKSLFGNAGESIQQYFKEYFAEWLISSLTPLDPNGWIGGTIVKAIGNLPISDISKLTDCNFTTKLISKSIADEAIDQLKNKAGMEGAFYDILRNAVVESLFESDLGQKIESALGNILCPSLSKVSSKMSDITDTMKKGALSLS